MNLLEIRNLAVDIAVEGKIVHAVRDVSFCIQPGSILALAGESGSGKSITALSITRILPKSAAIINGTVYFEGRDLLALKESDLRKIRGAKISYIFQEPAAYLNPVLTIAQQIGETIVYHRGINKKGAVKEAGELLAMVKINDPLHVLSRYPHQLSGGMNQRVMIAMALASNPDLLIADEPTTALDVITEAEVLRLILELRDKLGFAALFITHDFSVVNRVADEAVIMYRGEVVETGSKDKVFSRPEHSHTKELVSAYKEIYNPAWRQSLL